MELEKLCNICNEYVIKYRLVDVFNYICIFVNKGYDDVIVDISVKMELFIEELFNSKDGVLLEYLNKYFILFIKVYKSLFDN